MKEIQPTRASGRIEHGTTAASQAPGLVMAGMLTEGWLQWSLVVIGAWLAASPPLLGSRSLALSVSDSASGVAVVVLAALAFVTRKPWFALASCGVGLWLLFAPLVFWAPTAAAYTNDTLVGALVIAFALVIPMRMEMAGPDVPPGWSYNPSTWQQRLPIILLGLVSFLISHYMAAYQLGHIRGVWDPFFHPGTPAVLTSRISKAWPVSDAGLGSLVYLLEVLSGLMGDARRWRTMPWMVAMFGVAVVPLGVASIVLVILQPLAVGTWCTLCLATALFMLLMIPLALDEVVAMGQFLAREVRSGRSFWKAFFLGGVSEEEVAVHRPSNTWKPQAMFWGLSTPWSLLGSAALGGWLMVSPALLAAHGAMANSDHLIGALVITFALIAWAEVGRAVRFVNVLLGLWVLAAPWLLPGASASEHGVDLAVGLALIAASLPRGEIRERYGSWGRFIR